MSDFINIQNLYESIYPYDFFNEDLDVENFNWTSFFYKAAELNTFYTLLEKFEKLDNETSDDKDRYKITTLKGSEVFLILDYYKKNKIDTFISTGIQAGNYKKSDPTIEYFNNLKSLIGDNINNELCFIRFEDAQGNFVLTGNSKLDSFEIFSGLRKSILDSFNNRNIKNVFGIVMLIDNNEKDRRLPLYKKLIEKYLPIYSNIFVDEVSDTKYTHLIATK